MEQANVRTLKSITVCWEFNAMLKNMKQFFKSRIKPALKGENEADSEESLRLATAALLVEMTRADFDVNDDERAAVDSALCDFFALTPDEVRELVVLAESEVKYSACLYQFTSEVDKNLSYAQKTKIVEMLWRVAFSDQHKDKHEEHLIRKIADLLHLSHKDFIQTRHKVEDSLGNDPA